MLLPFPTPTADYTVSLLASKARINNFHCFRSNRLEFLFRKLFSFPIHHCRFVRRTRSNNAMLRGKFVEQNTFGLIFLTPLR